MPAHRHPRWTPAELATLRAHYPAEGIEVGARLPGRSWKSIHVKAWKLGLRCTREVPAPAARLHGAALERAIGLRQEQGWSFARIGAAVGVSEGAACNAVLAALCLRSGFTPAQRTPSGRLTAEGLERLRLALRKGLKGVDIQLRLGLSAGRVAEERRRYNADLKSRGKAALPPPGGGVAYSGIKLTRAQKGAVESLFMAGFGAAKINQRTGVSHTSIGRIRARLIRRLARKGQVLPGCDAAGARHVVAESTAHVHPLQLAEFRRMLMAATPVRRAAAQAGIGTCTAYRLRDDLARELAAIGLPLPEPVRPGRVRAGAFAEADWPPRSLAEHYAFRLLLAEPDATFAGAKTAWQAARRSARTAAQGEAREALQSQAGRPRTFEDQLAAVASGRLGITAAFLPHAHLQPRLRAEARPPAPGN